MKRLIAAAVLVAGLSGGFGHHAGAQDEVTLTVGLVQDMSSPNVTVGYLVPEFDVWNLQYATLTDKAADDFATIPGLAESWEQSDNGLTYTYKLRDGLKWSDGAALTADDVAYTINRSRDEQWANHYSTTQNLTATAVDARTVKITSSVPDPKLPTMDVYIVPKHIYEKLDADALADYDAMDGVASGPYSLKAWRSGQDWTMVKNPNWWGRDNGIDRIVFRVFTNADAMVAALQKGEIDFAHDIPYPSVDLLRKTDGITVVDGQQGGFTELALNGMAGGIGDGHPALQDINVRHAIYYAIDRDVLFNRVALGLGGKGTTMSPSADPSWMPDLGDEAYTYDPEKAKKILDDAGYVDTDGDGIREMPGGGQKLEFRYVVRSESTIAAPIQEFISGWLKDIGISTVVSVMDDTQLYDVQIAGNYDMFVWGWTPYVDPDPQLSYFTCDQVTTDPDNPGSNDANWCSKDYDALYQQQKVELDSAKRHDIVHDMLKLFNRESTYLVLLQDADMQGYRTDRFEGWEPQPAPDGPVLFTNTSPSYVNLSVIGGSDDGGGGVNVLLIVGIAVAVVAVIGIGAFVMKRRSADENRE
jgi:peptide/nickel transport system substrate-binding protein